LSKETSATRYAKAVFEIAVERHELEKWRTDLDIIAIPGRDPVVSDLLENPTIHSDDKIKVLTAAFGGISPLALNLVRLLVVKGNFNLAPEISVNYQQLLDQHNGVERAEVVTAVPLSDDDKKNVEAHLGALINKRVVIRQKVDPDLIGGIIARVGGKLLDGSVRTKLENLKREIGTIS
jgi:F-type H+-transporting ATPase subunit delta